MHISSDHTGLFRKVHTTTITDYAENGDKITVSVTKRNLQKSIDAALKLHKLAIERSKRA